MTDREFDAASTLIEIPGVQNFRDAGVGGLRPGLLYRSGSFHLLTPDGAQRLKRLGIRTVIDLRSATELAVWPDELHGLDLDRISLPLRPEQEDGSCSPWPAGQAETYLFMAEVGGPAIAGTIRRLAAPGGLPTVIHCAVGKDRTGLTVAIIQSLAGLSEAEIIADFLRSNPNLGLANGPIPYINEDGEERLSLPVVAAHLLAALALIRDQHGTIENYLLTHGATSSDLAAVRTLLAP